MTRALVVALLLGACQAKPEQAPPPASSAPPPPPRASAAPTHPPGTTWYQGTWQGAYKSELFRLETAAGGLKAWKQDDGAQATGDGKLTIEVGADGTVSGTASGPLGEQRVSGKVDDDRAALSLIAQQPGGFNGVLLAQRKDGGMEGTLNASSGDSLSARKATVTLSRATP